MSRIPIEQAPLRFHRHRPRDGAVDAPERSASDGTVNRRQAMTLMAASLALAGGGCARHPRQDIYPYVHMPEAGVHGLPSYYASAFVIDGYAHGVLVGTKEGRPIKIEGNPSHPSSLGRTSVFAQASVLQLWDPDRSPSVTRRLAPAGQGPGPMPLPADSSWSAFDRFWHEDTAPRLRARQGEGLHLLVGPFTSPTMREQAAAVLEHFPRARWHRGSALEPAAARAGARLAFGREATPLWHFERARCVLSLGADPFSLSEHPGAVRYAADWASLRERMRSDHRAPSVIAAETMPGLFGSRADDRMALPPNDIEGLLWRLAPVLLGARDHETALSAQERRIVQALQHAGPDALVLAGPQLSAPAHAMVHALNHRAGAFGRTVEFIEPPDAMPEAGGLAELVDAMNAGVVDTLVMLGVNPLYDAPANLRFAEALQKVRASVHAGLYRDETANACDWHLPLPHAYEQWSDALAHDGTAGLVQPAIEPLYDTRSVHELLAMFSGATAEDAHAIVQRHWRKRGAAGTGPGAFEAFWRKSLQRGVIDGTASAPLSIAAVTPPQAPHSAALPAGALAALFVPDQSVHDGSFANIGWLQELPRSFSKMTWDNAVLMGPQTCRRLGLQNGDIVRLRIDRHVVDAPVWALQGHAEESATLPLGYGRRSAGRVGNGVGFDAYRIRPDAAGAVPMQIERTGRRHDFFALTQHALDADGRDMARILPPGGRIPDPGLVQPTLYDAYRYPDHAWAMAIDLDTCIGCNACTIACQAENNIPVVGKEQVALGREMHWIRVDRYASHEVAGTVWQPVPCMHCENAPCELVCPVGATVHDSEGLNVQVYNRCVGTRFCSNNCPYKVRRFNFLQYVDEVTDTLKEQRNPDVTVRHRGVMEKCTYCLQRIARGRHHEETSGQRLRDGDVVTACQAACPTQAIHFGDLDDPHSQVLALRSSPRFYALLGELNTVPRTTYLARIGADKTPERS